MWRSSSQHPGWPTAVGPLRVAAGVVRLRPVRLRDAVSMEPHAAGRPESSGALGAEHRAGLDCAAFDFGVARAVFELAVRSPQRPHAAVLIELDGEFCGQLTIGNVTHGALRSAWIGYWVSSSVTGGGVATGALALGLDHCFGPVRLHRVEATVRPENAASRAVLAKVGFREEGLLRRYLQVDGGWRDHLVVGLTIEEVYGSVTSALVRDGHASWACPATIGLSPANMRGVSCYQRDFCD